MTAQRDSECGTSKMYKKRVFSVLLVSFLLCISIFCQVAYSDDVLTLDDLPSSGESLVVTSDSVFTVNEGETAVIEGVISVNGTDDSMTEVHITNYGDLTIKSTTIHCDSANLTIENRGTLTVQTCHFTVIGNSTLNFGNTVDCSMTDLSIDIYGGYAYLQNVGSLIIQNGYFKDQFDGTFISNYGEATLSECNFVANGAEGKIEIFSSGDLQLSHGVFDVNYGGKVNVNSLTGTLTMTECSADISGASHGTRSEINILCGNSTWESCSFVNNDAKINYLNTGEFTANNFTISQSGADASTIFSSSGPTVFENFQFSGSGSTSITNWDSMKFIDSVFDSSSYLNLMNNAELVTENWLVKTTSSAARIVIYVGNNGSIAFNEPFVENVSTEVLTSIGSEGQEFVESSGGTITVTNNGLMTQQSSGHDISEYLLYGLVIIVAVAVSLFVILKNRKKSSPETS